jgi:hypothetical protein
MVNMSQSILFVYLLGSSYLHQPVAEGVRASTNENILQIKVSNLKCSCFIQAQNI